MFFKPKYNNDLILHNIKCINNFNIDDLIKAYKIYKLIEHIENGYINLHELKPLFPDQDHKQIKSDLEMFNYYNNFIKSIDIIKPYKVENYQGAFVTLRKSESGLKEIFFQQNKF
jgi:hypothetical protein